MTCCCTPVPPGCIAPEPAATAAHPRPQPLAEGRLLTLQGPCRVRCLAGQLWVTVEGEAADFIVDAGSELAVTASGKVVVEALQAGVVALRA